MCFNTSVWPDLKLWKDLLMGITAFLSVIFLRPYDAEYKYR